jgi:2-phosphosulfolactate phosphatase
MSQATGEKKLLVDVCLSPLLYPAYHRPDAIVVVIDIFRATSAICTAFQYGVAEMIPVASLTEAQSYKDRGFMVGAERDGSALEGFDFGNSTTTNGTQAIAAAKQARQIVIGSFLNITALCNWLIQEQKEVILLCSGWKNRFSMEDSLFAGAVSERLSTASSLFNLGDASLAAKYIFESAQHNPYRLLHGSSHKERLAALGLKEDIKYCLSLDKTDVIPVLRGDVLVKLAF